MIRKLTDHQIFVLEKGEFTCSDVQKLYGDYYDGELPSSLSGRIDAHTEDCKSCQEFVATYKFTLDLAKELGAATKLPSDVQSRLRAALNERLGINLPHS